MENRPLECGEIGKKRLRILGKLKGVRRNILDEDEGRLQKLGRRKRRKPVENGKKGVRYKERGRMVAKRARGGEK